MRSCALPLLLAALAAGCGDPPGAATNRTDTPTDWGGPASRPVPPIPPTSPRGCGFDEYRTERMGRHPALIGRTADDLLAAYGRPHGEDRFRAGEGLGTYRGGVASQLPGGAERNARTPVREIVWQRAGCNFIVRFHQQDGAWRVFDSFQASADADF